MDAVTLKEVRVRVIGTEAREQGHRPEFGGNERQPAGQDPDVYIGEPEPTARAAAAAFELRLQARRDEDTDASARAKAAVHVEAATPGRVAAEGAELHRPPLLRCGGHGSDERRETDHDCCLEHCHSP